MLRFGVLVETCLDFEGFGFRHWISLCDFVMR